MDLDLVHPATVPTAVAASAVAATAPSTLATCLATNLALTAVAAAISAVHVAGCGSIRAGDAGSVLRRRVRRATTTGQPAIRHLPYDSYVPGGVYLASANAAIATATVASAAA